MTAISATVGTARQTTKTQSPRTQTTTTAKAKVLEDTQQGPNHRAIYMSSILAVTLFFLVGVGLPCSIYLDDWTAGFGLGAFCAFWGGPSFGVMTGAARVSAWFEANEEH